MKASEAPKKIHISIVPNSLNSYTYITCSKDFPNAVEYTCTDIFIEKACKWLEKNIVEATGIDSYTITESFKKAMKEE